MGSPQLAFIDDCAQCMNEGFIFPSITLPGLPNFALGIFLSLLAGFEFILDFLPPDPLNLPSLPTLSLFIDPFLAGLAYDFTFPPDLDLINFGIQVPGGRFPIFGLFAFFKAILFTIFGSFLFVIESIFDLALKLPTIQVIVDIFLEIALSVGLVGKIMIDFAFCLAGAVFNIFKIFIPI